MDFGGGGDVEMKVGYAWVASKNRGFGETDQNRGSGETDGVGRCIQWTRDY